MAIGEWDNGQNSHGGLGYYLRESGRNVLNIAQPGKSDFVYIKVLENFLDYNPSINVDKINIMPNCKNKDGKSLLDIYTLTSKDIN